MNRVLLYYLRSASENLVTFDLDGPNIEREVISRVGLFTFTTFWMRFPTEISIKSELSVLNFPKIP